MSGGNTERDLVAEEEERLRRSGIEPRRTGRRRGMDDGTRRLALTAGGLGAALVAVVGGWTLVGHRPHGIPVIEPPPGPIRVKPEQPGGMQVSALGEGGSTGSGTTTLAPPPEEAHPELLQAEIAAAKRAEQAEAAHPDAAGSTVVPATTAPTPAPAAGAGASGAGGQVPAAAPVPIPTPGPTAAPVSARPAPVPVARTRDADQEEAVAPGVPAAQEAPVATAGNGERGHAVQLAALDSEAAAQTEWTRLAREAPDLFAHREPVVVPVERDGKRFFRLRTGGFDSLADATRFCGSLKAKGIACTLAEF